MGVSAPQPRPSPELPVAMETGKEEGSPLHSAPSSPHSLNVSTASSDPGHVTAGVVGLALPLRFLCEGHAQLGKVGWCCRDSGAFLLESVSALRRELKVLTRLPLKQREVSGLWLRGVAFVAPPPLISSILQVLLQELEQCYYCLYGHPNKRAKVRGLVDHCEEQVCGCCRVQIQFSIPVHTCERISSDSTDMGIGPDADRALSSRTPPIH